MLNMKKEVIEMKYDLDLLDKEYCSDEEVQEIKKNGNLFSKDVRVDEYGYFRYIETEIDNEVVNQLLLYKQLKCLKVIRNCMIFFAIICALLFLLRFFY